MTKQTSKTSKTSKAAKLQAISELFEMGSHSIVSGKFANQCGEPFGLTFTERKFTNPDRDPRGVIADCTGVDIHLIASRINETVGGEYQPYSGRGARFRAELAEARRMVELLED